ncbi:TonB-dependent receptor [Marinilabiliaceae bacterium JC017]|nr:TonB-dependent receptor [Marinilabiliaceae bacterium JC017]
MKKVLLALSFLVVFGLQAMLAQTKNITGTVTDAGDGAPIPGVSVFVKGTTVGTVTRPDGVYTLAVPSEATTLVFSFVGMKAQEIAIEGKATIDVVLQSDAVDVAEVVVTGYSTRKKDVIASAMSTITTEEMKDMVPSTTIDNMLQGKAAGVDATALNGKPGNTATVKIRGAVSLNTKGGDRAQPLYVIDGVFLSEEDLNALNPNDIESMSVLKDAAGASIYGSRGANGVVVITTKQGRKGQEARISLSSRYGVGNKIDDPYDMMNAAQKIEYEEALGEASYTPEEKERMLGFDHDWQDDILKQAIIQSHSVSATGGGTNSTYFVSVGYDKNSGIVEHLDGFERYSGRLNYTSQLREKLSVGSNMSLSYSESDEPRDRYNAQNPFYAMYGYNPYTPVYNHDSEGNLILDDNGNPTYNPTNSGLPILEALEKNPEQERYFRMIGSVYATYDIMDGLSFKTQYSGTYIRFQREYYVEPGSILDGYVGDKSAPGSKDDRGRDTFNYSWLNQLTYQKTIDKHNFDVMLLTEYSKGSWYSYRLSSKGYASADLTTQENGSEATRATTSREEYSMFSLAAAANYDWDGKYLASASIRRDGASRFGTDEKYGIFWSGSLAWNMAREDFMSSAEFLDDLKVRVSYGTLGNWNIPNYASQGYYQFGSYIGQSAGIIRPNVANPELTWEEQVSTNFGVESSLFNGRISAAVDYFINTRTDFLFENPLSWEGGSYTQYTNAGKMTTNGLEMELNGDIIRTKDLRWSMGLNMTFIDYEVNELNGQDQIVIDGDNVLKEGEEPFAFYLPRYAGVNPNNGNAQYLDKEGNITETYSSGNKVILSGKSPLANLYGGVRTSVSYKGIDLAADFSFKSGNYTYNQMAFDMLSDGEGITSNQRADALNYWKKPGDKNVLPKPMTNANQSSDRFLQDASYIRFRNLTVGYTLPVKLVQKIKLNKVRIYAQAQNLHTWTNFEGDPEVSVGSGESQLGATQNFIPGAFTLYSYPATRSFMFGIDINF